MATRVTSDSFARSFPLAAQAQELDARAERAWAKAQEHARYAAQAQERGDYRTVALEHAASDLYLADEENYRAQASRIRARMHGSER